MKWLILGAGFGLYGYLPALIYSDNQVVLPKRYEAIVDNRSELTPFKNKIIWLNDEIEALKHCDGIIIAKRPQDQAEFLSNILYKYDNICYILAEKPLAPTPVLSKELLRLLTESHKHYRIGYLFIFLDWVRIIENLIQNPGTEKINLRWSFKAHHYLHNCDNWKRHHDQGGSVLRFYGIHLIALMAQLGYTDLIKSVISGRGDELLSWSATFSNKDLPHIGLSIDSCSYEKIYQISSQTKDRVCNLDYSASSPFGTPSFKEVDLRVSAIGKHIDSIQDSDSNYYRWYYKSNDLWSVIESESEYRQ